MAETLNRLCCYLIRDDFGPIVEQVAKVLLQKGRLTLPVIAKLSKFTLTKTRECLFILIQHNLVYWADARESQKIGIYYSIEIDEILARLNFGIYIKNANEWIESRHASELVKYILLNGKVTFGGLVEDQKINKKSSRYKDIKETFSKMIEKKYILSVDFTDSKSARDKASEAEQRELAKVTNFIPTKKQMAEAKAKLAANLDSEDTAIGSKRRLNLENLDRPTKQQKGEITIDDNQYFRVNYEKFNVKERNKRFAKFVRDRINRSAGTIIKYILDIADCDKASEVESCSISLYRILKIIPESKDELFGQQMKTEKGKTVTRESLIKQYLDHLIDDDANILCKRDENMGGMYFVRYNALCESLKQQVFENIILEKFGTKGARILKVLHTKQKLDEKAITAFTLMSVTDVRQKLIELLNAGFAQVQEVPRSGDRAPSRTFFFWYVDYNKCYEIILNNYYRTLANIHQVRFEQESGAARLLDKKEKEDALKQLNSNTFIQLLTENETKALSDLEFILTQLDTAQLRMVQDVMLFKNFK
ncbi:18383_t:CDS:10 [Dentiscutata erythropus]|uniref:DNA-directed RNA polymerase III subunit RPC3 n=1 Tax=Dentiscutata erythropus TaxID=1348616 RepID=A0A9N9C6Q0_9GLOM|nr:18383_t:CDS:10 [Dentiscutata erythropus]